MEFQVQNVLYQISQFVVSNFISVKALSKLRVVLVDHVMFLFPVGTTDLVLGGVVYFSMALLKKMKLM